MPSFGEQLRKLRTGKGFSLDELAALSGVTKAYLWRLETSPGVNPSIEVVRKLASGLKVSVGDLVDPDALRVRDNVEIPPSLEEARDQFNISDEELADLARIRFRGSQPLTAEDWGLLYLQLKKTMSGR